MPSARGKKDDVVVVTSEHSDYAGQVGTVESLTKTRLSARVLFESGNRATVRIGSLEVHPERAALNSSVPLEVTAEILTRFERTRQSRNLDDVMYRPGYPRRPGYPLLRPNRAYRPRMIREGSTASPLRHHPGLRAKAMMPDYSRERDNVTKQ